MILIFGGAYQGKLEYAVEKYRLQIDDIHYCDRKGQPLDLEKKAVYGLEDFVYGCITKGLEPMDEIKGCVEQLRDKVVICQDISQGIVPMDKVERRWREDVGRVMNYLSGQADEVIRIFCGIGSKVK